MPCISDLTEDEQASSFWQDTRSLRLYLIGSLSLVFWYRVYMIVADVVANWWHTRTALETISHWWK
jgi:hypothetical protein